MASKSGRSGQFPPESKEVIEDALHQDVSMYDGLKKRSSKKPRRTSSKGSSMSTSPVPFSEDIVSGKKASSSAADGKSKSPANVAGHPPEGCKVCHRDDDHSNLLLCEACNDEYHTYCLNPPLQSVPEGDFFCGKFGA